MAYTTRRSVSLMSKFGCLSLCHIGDANEMRRLIDRCRHGFSIIAILSIKLSWVELNYKLPTAHLDASPYQWSQFLVHSVNLIVFTLLLVHLILRISPHHSHHLRSHHLSLPRPFTTHLKLISFTNPFLRSLLIPSGLPSRILNLYWTKWALALVCFSFVC